MLESILKRDPDHLGANHYYIHAVEASTYPERALMSAERLRRLLPDSGHILHMPAHIYLLVGDYHLAAQCNEEAVAADRAYIKKYGLDGVYPLHYLSHNLCFLSRAYCMEGRFEDSYRIAQDLFHFYNPYFKDMPDLEYYLSTPLLVLLHFQKWDEILNYPAPEPQQKATTALWHFSRAFAYASAGKTPQALEEQKQFLKIKADITSDMKFGYNQLAPIVDLADLTLKSKLAEVQNDTQTALTYLQKAVSIQDSLHYNEPPDWSFSTRVSLGALYLRNKHYAEAEQVFRADLAKHPRNGRALFGLLESLKGQSKGTDAFWVEGEFQKAWKYSTADLTIENL